MEEGAEDSATELTLPILVATIGILIVYLPIMFFSGIIKYLFVPLDPGEDSGTITLSPRVRRRQ
jgi:multidrug efflux pump subunit AcrB